MSLQGQTRATSTWGFCRTPINLHSHLRSASQLHHHFPGNLLHTAPHNLISIIAMASSSHTPPPPPPDPAKPPYSLLSSPVYSLATSDLQGNNHTLNLVTYASPISIVPRFYALGLYRGTLSAENMLATGKGVLQILAAHHAPLFELLGKTSGKTVDKYAELASKGVPVKEFAGQHVIADCIGVISLRIVSFNPSGAGIDNEKDESGDNKIDFFPAGDHDVVICAVEEFETFKGDDLEPLYTAQLRKEGYM
jgi:flavin reductase (DIM6/NTAB) family NADH-FMN oxidoreductase RutF